MFCEKILKSKGGMRFPETAKSATCSQWLELLLIKVLLVKIIFARTSRLYLQCLTCSNNQ